MIIAAAQTVPENEDIAGNLEDHIRLTQLAASRGARLIVFPELSITGYEREKAESLEFVPDDPRLSALRILSAAENIIIIAGAPIRRDMGLHIGAFIFFPDQTETIYTKQYLHDGEELYFVPGNNDAFQIILDNESISLAICADITNRAHPIKAASLNSSIYLASIFYIPNGISEGYETLQSYAKEFSMHVLMSNYGGSSYGLDAAGKSAFWNSDGERIGEFEGNGEGLIIVQKFADVWKAEIINT